MTTLVWKTTIDENTCDECRALDGSKISDIGFMPPLHGGNDSTGQIPCRCIVVETMTDIEMQQKVVSALWDAGMDVSHTATSIINVTADDGSEFQLTIVRSR